MILLIGLFANFRLIRQAFSVVSRIVRFPSRQVDVCRKGGNAHRVPFESAHGGGAKDYGIDQGADQFTLHLKKEGHASLEKTPFVVRVFLFFIEPD